MTDKKKNTKKIVLIIVGVLLAIGVLALVTVMYVNAGYKTLKSNFGYKMTYNTREYEYTNTGNSLDVFQIKDLESAKTDCYIYVGNYDPTQDLNETLEIVNRTDGTKHNFMNTNIGSGNYPAIFVSYKTDKGGYQYIYFVDYAGKNYVISTLADDDHVNDIEKMLASFTIL